MLKSFEYDRRHRRAFTLVELLISIVIIGILAALGYGAYITTMGSARTKKTQQLIQTLHNAIDERVQVLRKEQLATTGPAPGIIGTTYTINQLARVNPANQPAAGTAQAQTTKQRADVIAYMALLTKALPQQFYDIAPFDIPNKGSYTGMFASINETQPALGGALLREYQKKMQLDEEHKLVDPEDGVPGNPPVFDFNDYNTWELGLFPFGTHSAHGDPIFHDPDTESSECLYLILSVNMPGCSISVADIPSEYIADTDGDGMMEFIDGWGKPLRFYRFPTDYYAYLIEITRELPATRVVNTVDPQSLLVDPEWFGSTTPNPNARRMLETAGMFRTHKAYRTVGDPASEPNAAVAAIYPTSPLIVSAGPDGQFGFWTPYSTSAGTTTKSIAKPDAYTTAQPDKYLYLYYRSARPDPAEIEYLADNVTNVMMPALQASN